MRAAILFILLTIFVSPSFSEETDITTCGIPNSEIPAYMLNAYTYAELLQNDEIAADEAVVWEYSTNSYCKSYEYQENLNESLGREVEKTNDGTNSLGPVFRNGFKDRCQYRAIVSIKHSPFKFLSKFKRRMQTMEFNGEYVTWFIHGNKSGIKFIHRHPKETIRECVENGI